ncbi:MAG: 2-oxoacid:acceptor oxidoreductase family protein [Phycisphaerales bacterium]|nr:MAG: 2-oxoacid:acceptor oxidoreductase family protein [Phycisphaerales bacterium]
MSRTEIRITGFGGQGVVLSGYIIGRACAIHANKHATMIQSFGPEARGSACSATLAVSDTRVLYPYIRRPDVFVVMSAEGYENYRDELKDDGTLVYEENLVHPTLKQGQPSFGIPSTRIAESLGRSIVQNIVMLGFFTAVTKLVSRDEMREAVKQSVPAGTEELNLKAFDAGCAHFDDVYAQGGQEKAAAAAEPTGQR